METSQETGTFLLVNIAAQRARQLMQGAAPLIRTKSRKPAAIAIKEVEKGLLPFYTSDEAAQLLEEDTEEAAEPEE